MIWITKFCLKKVHLCYLRCLSFPLTTKTYGARCCLPISALSHVGDDENKRMPSYLLLLLVKIKDFRPYSCHVFFRCFVLFIR